MSKLAELLDIANKRFGRSMPMPSVFFDCHDTRGGYHQSGTLHFNPTLLNQNLAHYMDITVVHEMAHYVQKIVFPDSLEVRLKWNGRVKRREVHGRAWQSIMRLFGIREPERCHSYDVTDVRKRVYRRYPIYCGCEKPHMATLKLVNKITSGRKYTCTICRKSISLIKPLTSAPQPIEYSI